MVFGIGDFFILQMDVAGSFDISVNSYQTWYDVAGGSNLPRQCCQNLISRRPINICKLTCNRFCTKNNIQCYVLKEELARGYLIYMIITTGIIIFRLWSFWVIISCSLKSGWQNSEKSSASCKDLNINSCKNFKAHYFPCMHRDCM
jgi:hypothetical protein